MIIYVHIYIIIHIHIYIIHVHRDLCISINIHVNVSLWITRREWIASVYLDPQLKKAKELVKYELSTG